MRAGYAQKATQSLSKASAEPRLDAIQLRFPRWLQVAFWLCIGIASAAALRRVLALLGVSGKTQPSQLVQLDSWFASHAALTWVHVLCALAFVALLPFLFWHRLQAARWLQRLFFALGLSVGLTAYAMSIHAVGGWLERSAVLLFNTLFLIALARRFVSDRRGDRVQKRRWTIRAVAILLGVASTRPVMGVFFATSPITHWTPQEFFGVAFWIGFTLNTLVIEIWLRKSRFVEEGSLREYNQDR